MSTKILHDIKTKKVGDFLWRSEFTIELPCTFLSNFKYYGELVFVNSFLCTDWGFESDNYSGYRQSRPFFSYALTEESVIKMAKAQIELLIDQLKIFKEIHPPEENQENFTEI